jgi:inosine-uridine nucleoside N-ribohydrolase
MAIRNWLAALAIALATALVSTASARTAARDRVLIDTDMGDDIDDAFAIGLALHSPELEILGIAAGSGDSHARARVLGRFLDDVGAATIPIAVGRPTKLPGQDFWSMTQRRFGEAHPDSAREYPDAADFMLSVIRQHPGEMTIIAMGPLSDLGAMIEQDPETFRKVKRVVLMGGWFKPAFSVSSRVSLISGAPERTDGVEHLR